MRLAVMDCETNGLLEQVHTVHSLVLRDYLTDEVVSCADREGYHPISHGLSLLSEADIIFAHNGIAYDVPALQKVYPRWTYKGRIFDTLVAARCRWAHIKETDYDLLRKGRLPGKLIGRHSLEAWGFRMGIHKGEFGKTADWQEWSPEMQKYCERDTLVTRELLLRLKKAGYSKQAIDAEMELAWTLAAMERNGWPFDEAKAQELQVILAAKREAVAQRLRDAFGQFKVRNGKPFTPKRDNKKLGYVKGVEVQKYKVVDFNPASRDHIAMQLTERYGWKPETFTEGGKPEVDEGTLKGLPYPEVPDLLEYLLLDKRLGQLSEGKEAWLKAATRERTDGGKLTGLPHIHGSINSGGTVTHRASHSHPNIGQVPKVGKPYGAECRALFTAPPGWTLVGADMSGLELRCLAHYMAKWDDMAYGRIILEGKNEDRTDIHSVNQRALGLPDEPCDGRTTKGRDATKTYFYAYLYGAGDLKLGTILYPALSEKLRKEKGRESRKKFEGGLPALGYLVEALKLRTKKNGYITLIDGRRAYVRSEHAVLNTLLQGTGAVLCKHWINDFVRQMVRFYDQPSWRGQWSLCGWIHDETQTATKEEIAGHTAQLAVASAEAMTDLFQFRCPLTGEAKIGRDWASTH